MSLVCIVSPLPSDKEDDRFKPREAASVHVTANANKPRIFWSDTPIFHKSTLHVANIILPLLAVWSNPIVYICVAPWLSLVCQETTGFVHDNLHLVCNGLSRPLEKKFKEIISLSYTNIYDQISPLET